VPIFIRLEQCGVGFAQPFLFIFNTFYFFQFRDFWFVLGEFFLFILGGID
jgi:hypothetical protein